MTARYVSLDRPFAWLMPPLVYAPRGGTRGYDSDSPDRLSEPLRDTFAGTREYGAVTVGHEGTDVYTHRGTPVVNVLADAVLIRTGWSQWGGWGMTVAGRDAAGRWRITYYGHLYGRADLAQGDALLPGDLLGFSGNTGGGPPGTSRGGRPHLHIYIYCAVAGDDPPSRVIVRPGALGRLNPYPGLRAMLAADRRTPLDGPSWRRATPRCLAAIGHWRRQHGLDRPQENA